VRAGPITASRSSAGEWSRYRQSTRDYRHCGLKKAVDTVNAAEQKLQGSLRTRQAAAPCPESKRRGPTVLQKATVHLSVSSACCARKPRVSPMNGSWLLTIEWGRDNLPVVDLWNYIINGSIPARRSSRGDRRQRLTLATVPSRPGRERHWVHRERRQPGSDRPFAQRGRSAGPGHYA